MKTFLAGADVTVDVLFEQGADTVIPDLNTVTYTLYSNAGVALHTDVAVVTTSDSTQIAIIVVAADNAIAGDFETRTLLINYKMNGGTRQQQVQYRLIPFIPLAVSCDDVRTLIGFSKKELPDSDLNIYTAYLSVVDDLGIDLVTPALVAKDITTLSLNRAIACRALIDILPSLQLRALQLSKSNTAEVSRFSKINFDDLADWLWELYLAALLVIDPSDDTTIGQGLLAVTSSPDIDPVTASAPA